jgi:SCY1-like protein 1
VAAFTRSLRDPFVPARNAALLALGATADVFDETDCATKVVPAIAPSLVDKEKSIRDQAAKTMEQYLARIKTLTKNYPDTVVSPEAAAAGVAAPATTVMPGGWTSWAVGTLTAAAGQMQSRATPPAPAPAEDRPASAPITQVSPQRPAAPKPSASAAAFVPQPAGFLEDEDDDDVDGWGALDDDDTGTTGETFLDALEKKVGKKVAPSSSSNGASNSNSKLTATTGGVSTFGPKPFSLKTEEEVDFEALVGAKKAQKQLPKGLVKKTATMTTTTTTTQRRQVAAKKTTPAVKKAEAWDEGDADWGDDGWS